jgi:hypothetical protein
LLAGHFRVNFQILAHDSSFLGGYFFTIGRVNLAKK